MPEEQPRLRSSLPDVRNTTIQGWIEYLSHTVPRSGGENPEGYVLVLKSSILRMPLSKTEREEIYLRIDRAFEYVTQGEETVSTLGGLVTTDPSERRQRYSGGGPWIAAYREILPDVFVRYFFRWFLKKGLFYTALFALCLYLLRHSRYTGIAFVAGVVLINALFALKSRTKFSYKALRGEWLRGFLLLLLHPALVFYTFSYVRVRPTAAYEWAADYLLSDPGLLIIFFSAWWTSLIVGNYGLILIRANVYENRPVTSLYLTFLTAFLVAIPGFFILWLASDPINRAYNLLGAVILFILSFIVVEAYHIGVSFKLPERLSILLGAIPTFLVGKRILDAIPEPSNYVKGAKFAEAPASGFDPKPEDDPYALLVAGKWIGFARTVTGILVIGAIESGKSVLIRLMAQEVLPRIGDGLDWKAVFLDSKKEAYGILRGMGVKAPIVNMFPFDERAYWLRLPDDFSDAAGADRLGAVLCPPDPKADALWASGAADIMAAVAKVFQKYAVDENGRGAWRLRDLIEAMGDVRRLRAMLPLTADSMRVLNYYFGSDRMFAGFQATIGASIRNLRIVAALWDYHERKGHPSLSLRQWVNPEEKAEFKEESILLMIYVDEHGDTLRPLYHLVLSQIYTYMMSYSDSKTRRRWFFLDEFNSLKKIPGFVEATLRLRSKGLANILGVQDLGTAENDFGGENVIRPAIAQFATNVYLRLSDRKAAERASDHFGKTKLREVTYGWSTNSQWADLRARLSKGESEQERVTLDPLVMAEVFQYLPPTNRENGLTAFIKSYNEAYQRTLDGEELFHEVHGKLKQKDLTQTEHDSVPTWAQDLLPWTEEDLQRLGLSDIPELRETLYKTPQELAKERQQQEKLRMEQKARLAQEEESKELSPEEQFEAFQKFQQKKKKPRTPRKKTRGEDGRENVQ